MFSVIAFSLLFAVPESPHVVATVGGKPITIEQVETSAAGPLRQLEQQRYETIEGTLQKVIEEQVLDLEAKAQHTTREELIAKARAAEPTDAEIDAFYEQNKAQIAQKPKAELIPQIRKYLTEKKQGEGFRKYVDSLLTKYKVVYLLAPYRVPLESAGFPSRGPASAPVTIVEFVDFEGALASVMKPRLEEARQKYSEKVRVVIRQFPLPQHVKASFAANAALCANDQGKFWEMSDALLSNQSALELSDLKTTAARLGLTSETFNKCLDSGKHSNEIRADILAATRAGLTNPAVFVNGRPVLRPAKFDELFAIIEDELARTAH